MAQKIKIKIKDGKIDVSPRCQELKHPDNIDGVEWEPEDTALSFKVTFMGQSPFAPKFKFDKYDPKSGQITISEPQPEYDQFFRYKIEVPGYDAIDPGIIVWKQ